jgi:hypothetical protein
MADTSTTRYGLVKPGVGDVAGQDLWGDKLNNNFDTIDSALVRTKGFTEPANNAVLPAAARNASYYMRLDTGVQILNLPNVADIYDGWSCFVWTAAALPSGYQTSYVQCEAGKQIYFRDVGSQKFYLIGASEAFRFTWYGSFGTGVWVAECVRQPGEVKIRRYYTGSTSWNSGQTSFTPIGFNAFGYNNVVFDTTNSALTRVPVTGVYQHYYYYQPSASAGGGASGAANIAAYDASGSINTSVYYGYIGLTLGEDTQFMSAIWSSVLKAGDYSGAAYAMGTTSIWYYPANNSGLVKLMSR